MITYLVTKQHAYTIEFYLNTFGEPLAGRFRVVTYKSLVGGTAEFVAHPGTYIFSDIDRLTPQGAERAARAWKTISDLGGDARILNHPTRSMRRYELLRTLFERGDNTFNAYRLVECRQPQRWPVFIRQENEHTKNLTPLLHSPEELEAAVAEIFARGDSRENKLVVEFCDTQDDQGLFYLYTACLVGERVIPRALRASRGWMVAPETFVSTPEVLEKDRRYMETNPHERQLREIFRLARIDYGKIDYAILGDRLQVWEINTNPSIFLGTDLDDAERQAVLSQFAERIAAAFAEIDVRDDTYGPEPPVSLR
jgi:hypothetical protein